MKFRKSFLFGAALSSLMLSSPVFADTLNEALVKAYLNNPTLRAERASVRATDEGVSQALSNWRPEVTWSGSIARQNTENNSQANRVFNHSPTTSSFSVTQPLFRGFQTQSAIDEAEANVTASRWRLVDQEQTTLLEAVTAYSNVVRDQAVLSLNRNNEQVLQRQLEATQDRFEVGELTRTDVSQAQARFSRSTADRIQSEGDLDTSRAVYENIIGNLPNDLVFPTIPSDLPGDVNEAVTLSQKNNPVFLAASFDEKAAIENIDEVSGQLLPELNLVASYDTNYQTSNGNNKSTSANIGLTLDVPFYQQGSVYSQVRQAKQTAAQRRMELEEARRDAIEDTKSGWEGVVTARAQIQSFLDEIRSAEVALDGVQREAAVGSRTVLDVLDAEQELLDAKVNLVRAQRDEVVAVFELKQALGELTAEKMGLDTGIYDPNVHYDQVRNKWIGTDSVGNIDELMEVDNK